MFTEKFSEMSIYDKTAEISLFATIFLAICMLVVYLLIKKTRPESLDGFKKTVTGVVVGYVFAVASILLYLNIDSEGPIEKATFIPVACFMGAIIVLAIVGLCLSIFKKEKMGLFGKIAAGILGAFILAIIIANMVILYLNNTKEIDISSEVLLYILTVVLVAVNVVLAVYCGKKHPEHSHTKTIVYAGILVAMSFALSYVKLFSLTSGSITLASLLPLMLFSYMFGIRKGLLVGAIYGILQFIQSPWFYHPAQFLLDYPIAFGGIGIAGLFKELKVLENKQILQFIFGAIVACVLRYFAHVISGIFVWGSGNPNYTAVAWSFLYNSFTFADIAICIVAGAGLFVSKSFTAYLEKATI